MKFNSLEKYICKRFLHYFLSAAFILTGIIWLTRIVRYVEYMTVKNMAVGDFALLSSLLIPGLIEFLLPLIVFIATIFTINSFDESRELFIFKSSGLSKYQIIRPIAACSSLIILFNYLLVLYVSPYSHKKIEEIKMELTNQMLTASAEVGVFNRMSDQITVFVSEKGKGGTLKDVVIINKLKDKDMFVLARKARLIKHDNQVLLGLNEGKRLILDKAHNVNSSLIFNQYLTDLDFFNEEKNYFDFAVKLSSLYIHQLFDADIIKKLNKKEVISERQHRMLWPWLSLVFSLIVITILLYGNYNRKGNILKNIAASIAVLLVLAGYFVLKSFTMNRIDLVFVSYLYIMLLLISCLVFSEINRIKYLLSGKR